jgi:hypothetical protein
MFATVQTGLQRAVEQHVMLASGPVKILAAYLSPSRPLIEADLSSCLSGGFPVLIMGDLNAKHVD